MIFNQISRIVPIKPKVLACNVNHFPQSCRKHKTTVTNQKPIRGKPKNSNPLNNEKWLHLQPEPSLLNRQATTLIFLKLTCSIIRVYFRDGFSWCVDSWSFDWWKSCRKTYKETFCRNATILDELSSWTSDRKSFRTRDMNELPVKRNNQFNVKEYQAD